MTPIKKDTTIEVVRTTFSKKYESVNLKALELGMSSVQALAKHA